jgi:hypothetical protein
MRLASSAYRSKARRYCGTPCMGVPPNVGAPSG